ncbi:GDSL-type esterase/lipase family protein [Saccharopolyspora taberi]|uniref:GDSL-type esterase/lipase family protein n=1 Tax=Saccharopolyspora taberi TaxID=60895 RepID=A0ABN3VJC1_9PSEU
MRAHMSKIITLVVIAGVLVLAVVVSTRYLPERPQPPEQQLPSAVVTLGDSTLSGEGGGNYEPGTNGENGNWCHRSPAAAVHQLRLPAGVTPINLACSGARAEQVGANPAPGHPEMSQSKRLAELAHRYRITDVVVQIGANDDPGFGDVVFRCLEAWAGRSATGCEGQMRAEWPERVERMKPKVLAALHDVRTAMDSAGYAPDSYSLVVQSYASPVAPEVVPALQNLSGCPFLTQDMAWIRDTGVQELSDGLREVADQVGARFLDLSQAGRGHEACTDPGRTAENEWFTRLTVDWQGTKEDENRAPHAMQESFHANAAGHAQFGRCLGEFLASEAPAASCRADERGNLRAVTSDVAAQGAHP